MLIELLDYCGSDEAIANAARVSFASHDDWNTVPAGYTKQKSDKLIDYLANHEHTSPFRHNSITVRCKAPVFLARQLMKHQIGMSWNEESRRYVDSAPEFYIPEVWRSRPEGSLKQGSGCDEVKKIKIYHDEHLFEYTGDVSTEYKDMVDSCLQLYRDMLAGGVAPEMARMILPQSMYVTWVWTGSLLAFSHVYNLRIKANAQVEAQEFAAKLSDVIQPLFPISWTALTGEQV